MIHFKTFTQTLLEQAISLSAGLNRPGTGGSYQLWLLRRMGVRTDGPAMMAPGVSFINPKKLHLGRYVTIGANSRLVCWDDVTIGDDFMASDLLNINSGSHDPVTWQPKSAPIRIGSRVWVGTGVTICAGVEVGDDVVIGAGSVVVRSLPPGCLAAGVPARPIRPLAREEGAALWSPWQERSGFGAYAGHTPARKLATRLLARF